jgi:uncharacterized cupredoxin-like copper-binding protein
MATIDMENPMKKPTLALGLLLAVALPAFAHGDAAHKPYDASQVEVKTFGREGDPKHVDRVIRLVMKDNMRFSPEHLTVRRGETVRLVVHNGGQLLHELVLGTPVELAAHAALMKKFPDMEHADAHMAHVRPGRDGQIIWQFTQAGEFRFACLQPGHFEAGMVGRVTVR